MATVANTVTTASAIHDKIAKGPGLAGTLIFVVVLIIGLTYIGWNLSKDLTTLQGSSVLPYLLLGVALLVALAFEFRERLPRHGKRGGHRDLHPFPRSPHCSGLERLV